MDLSPFVFSSLSVLVVQWKHAVLSRRRPWVRIPSGTLSEECGLGDTLPDHVFDLVVELADTQRSER